MWRACSNRKEGGICGAGAGTWADLMVGVCGKDFFNYFHFLLVVEDKVLSPDLRMRIREQGHPGEWERE